MPTDMITIRDQVAADLEGIQAINRLAFAAHGTGNAAFSRIRAAARQTISLVAECDGEIAGHILFSPVTIDGTAVRGMGLGELAVLPARQRQGIGTALGQAGIGRLRKTSCPFAIVVGHAGYYPRFGFVPGSRHGLQCQWPGIDDPSFMVLILDAPRMMGISGVARFEDLG